MISLRLKEISDFIPSKSNILNIGTDHGLLEIYLTANKNCKCIGTDINENSILKARENVMKNNLDIKLIKTDGLTGLDLNDKIIVISGLGTKTILEILNKDLNNDLILQSNNNIKDLKKKLKKKKYFIYKEKSIFDNKWYTIIYFKKIKPFKLNKTIYKDNKQYLKYLIKIKNKELKHIPKDKFIVRTIKMLEIFKLRIKSI